MRVSSLLLCAAVLAGAASTAQVQAAPADASSVAALAQVIAGPQRSAAHRARDVYRHPLETLAFFGLRPDQAVVEIAPEGGWYAEILQPYLRQHGKYYADTAPPGTADMVLTFRNVHNWVKQGDLDARLHAFFVALKPGGVLGVVDHRARPGTPVAQMAATGYVTEDYVIEHARAAGFVLAGKSDVNANPRDDTKHPNGVWSLPPTLRGGKQDRAAMLAIGESDRMTLRFVKPGAAQ